MSDITPPIAIMSKAQYEKKEEQLRAADELAKAANCPISLDRNPRLRKALEKYSELRGMK